MSWTWTTEPPSEPGWYWVHLPGSDEVQIHRVISPSRYGTERTHWLGPIPPPEPPDA